MPPAIASDRERKLYNEEARRFGWIRSIVGGVRIEHVVIVGDIVGPHVVLRRFHDDHVL
jgi:hypothetical protein